MSELNRAPATLAERALHELVTLLLRLFNRGRERHFSLGPPH
jgi:hypothetical protein